MDIMTYSAVKDIGKKAGKARRVGPNTHFIADTDGSANGYFTVVGDYILYVDRFDRITVRNIITGVTTYSGATGTSMSYYGRIFDIGNGKVLLVSAYNTVASARILELSTGTFKTSATTVATAFSNPQAVMASYANGYLIIVNNGSYYDSEEGTIYQYEVSRVTIDSVNNTISTKTILGSNGYSNTQCTNVAGIVFDGTNYYIGHTDGHVAIVAAANIGVYFNNNPGTGGYIKKVYTGCRLGTLNGTKNPVYQIGNNIYFLSGSSAIRLDKTTNTIYPNFATNITSGGTYNHEIKKVVYNSKNFFIALKFFTMRAPESEALLCKGYITITTDNLDTFEFDCGFLSQVAPLYSTPLCAYLDTERSDGSKLAHFQMSIFQQVHHTVDLKPLLEEVIELCG